MWASDLFAVKMEDRKNQCPAFAGSSCTVWSHRLSVALSTFVKLNKNVMFPLTNDGRNGNLFKVVTQPELAGEPLGDGLAQLGSAVGRIQELPHRVPCARAAPGSGGPGGRSEPLRDRGPSSATTCLV